MQGCGTSAKDGLAAAGTTAAAAAAAAASAAAAAGGKFGVPRWGSGGRVGEGFDVT